MLIFYTGGYMKIIKILGTGCMKCEKLEQSARQAAEEMGIEFTIEKVKDLNKIMDYGVMMTPALVVDDEVKSVGKILDPDEIKKFLK
jgi:small redox-active disulfide protein 2